MAKKWTYIAKKGDGHGDSYGDGHGDVVGDGAGDCVGDGDGLTNTEYGYGWPLI